MKQDVHTGSLEKSHPIFRVPASGDFDTPTEIEIELSALARQCLDWRIPDTQTLSQEVHTWQQQRNDEVVKVLWQFTTNDARKKLKHLYPKVQL